jgi:uncharacterized protein YheU (UPF0270 family)
MDIPWQKIQPETLTALIDEFVTRDGTDYGLREANHQTKIEQVLKLIKAGKIKVVFDAETESCDLREVTSR